MALVVWSRMFKTANEKQLTNSLNRFLIAGLGNPGSEYENTRHNIGFLILDELARAAGEKFSSSRLAFRSSFSIKGKKVLLIKPVTFMNLSGKAVNYYLQKEKIQVKNLLVIADDVALPIGKIRIKPKGSDGGHNGLANIQQMLGTNEYARLRFGIGNVYPKGAQSDYVLGEWTDEEKKIILSRIELAAEAVKSFILSGLEKTMNQYNSK